MFFEVKGKTHDSYYASRYGYSAPKPFCVTVSDVNSETEAILAAIAHIQNSEGKLATVHSVQRTHLVPSALQWDLSQPWYTQKLVAFDVETTGLDRIENRIVEIGFSEFNPVDKKFGSAKSFFLNEGHEIPDKAIAIHGIDNDMIADAPAFAELYEKEIKQMLEPGTILISHNRGFDMGFLLAAMGRMGEVLQAPCWCSMELALRTSVGQSNNKLGHLASVLEVEGSNSHRAGDDAQLCGDVFLALARRNIFFHRASLQDVIHFFSDMKY